MSQRSYPNSNSNWGHPGYQQQHLLNQNRANCDSQSLSPCIDRMSSTTIRSPPMNFDTSLPPLALQSKAEARKCSLPSISEVLSGPGVSLGFNNQERDFFFAPSAPIEIPMHSRSPSTNEYYSYSSSDPRNYLYSSPPKQSHSFPDSFKPSYSHSFPYFTDDSINKRPRRKYHEVRRIYACNYATCDKAYGALNHLNSHILSQGHGRRRRAYEFHHITRNL